MVTKFKSKKTKALGFYGTGGQFTLIYRELRVCDAYRVLTAKQKLLLMDMIRVYRKVSQGDKVYPESGFQYVWEVCEEDVSESAFYRIRQRLIDIGFFEYPPEIQTNRAGAARRFLPSRKWTDYKPTAEAAKKLAKLNKCKKDRIADKQRSIAKHRASLGDDQNRSGVSESGLCNMSESGLCDTEKPDTTCPKVAYPEPLGDLESGLRISTIPLGGAQAADIDELLAEIEAENMLARNWAPMPDELPELLKCELAAVCN